MGEKRLTSDRSPDDANVKNKMIFASSKDALRRRLDGECLLEDAENAIADIWISPLLPSRSFMLDYIFPGSTNAAAPTVVNLIIARTRFDIPTLLS